MSRRMTFQEAANVVKQSLDILDIIGRHVSLKKAGRSYTGLCPFHQEKSPSFYVTPDKQMYKCFGCGEGGDTLSFMMKYENKTYGEIIRDLAEDQDIDIISDGGRLNQVNKNEQEVLIQLHTLARTFYEEQLQQAEDVRAYLDDRQITPQWQSYFGLGYAPAGWENLVKVLRQQVELVQKAPNLLEKAGLANIRQEGGSYYDRFRNRLMIPIQDDRGRVVAFGGRALLPEDAPKYLNSPETLIYVKNKVLYGLSQAKESIRTTKYAILMEGYFDVISAHMAGLTQAVGVCGTALTENHLKLLTRAGAEKLYLCFDSDEAGQTAAVRAIEMVQNQLLDTGVTLKVVVLPGEKDPDDFLKSQGKDRFLACLENAQDFLSFKFARGLSRIPNLDSPEGRIQAVQVLIPMLLEIQQPVVRQEHLKLLSERLKLPEETLLLELKRLEKMNPGYQNKKNHEFQAILKFPERYIGKKRWEAPQVRHKPEDIRVFRKHLSEKLPVEEKEHLLLSYLLNEESYRLVMDTVKQMELQSPAALSFLKAVHAFEGQWRSINELIQHLTAQFHADENNDMLQYLAHRVVVMDEIQQSMEHSGRGLKSLDNREKLERDIEDITEKIQFLRKQASLSSLALDGRQHEQQADDQSALQVQLRLREELKQRKAKNTAQDNSITLDSRISLEEEQGV